MPSRLLPRIPLCSMRAIFIVSLVGGSFEIKELSRQPRWITAKSTPNPPYKIKTLQTQQSLIPTQSPTGLIFGHTCLKKVFLFLKIHDFGHPREGVFSA